MASCFVLTLGTARRLVPDVLRVLGGKAEYNFPCSHFDLSNTSVTKNTVITITAWRTIQPILVPSAPFLTMKSQNVSSQSQSIFHHLFH